MDKDCGFPATDLHIDEISTALRLPNGKEQIDESLYETMDPAQEKDIECYDKKKEAALFLLQLKEKVKIPQSVIDNVVEGTTTLLKKSIQHLKRKLMEFLDSEGQDDLTVS